MATTTDRSATRCLAHLDHVASLLAAAAGHLTAARESNPDSTRDDDYRDLLTTLGKMSTTTRAVRRHTRKATR